MVSFDRADADGNSLSSVCQGLGLWLYMAAHRFAEADKGYDNDLQPGYPHLVTLPCVYLYHPCCLTGRQPST
jgi:hypothetical protein